MANDRMIIECTGCGFWRYWGKYYPSTGPYVFSDDCTAKSIAMFVDRHLQNCHNHSFGTDLGGDPLFKFHTENASDLDQFKWEGRPATVLRVVGDDAVDLDGNEEPLING